MDPDNLVLVLYETFSGDMEISGGNKYRFKCYQFLEYPVVLVVFHLPKNSKKLISFLEFFGISGLLCTYLLKALVMFSSCLLCFGPHAHSNMIALGLMYILNSIVCVESCYRHY